MNNDNLKVCLKHGKLVIPYEDECGFCLMREDRNHLLRENKNFEKQIELYKESNDYYSDTSINQTQLIGDCSRIQSKTEKGDYGEYGGKKPKRN